MVQTIVCILLVLILFILIKKMRCQYENKRDRGFRQDPLTGLPDRLQIEEQLNASIHQAALSTTQLAVILLDIDNFKRINDTRGHAFGDELLRMTSTKLLRCLRTQDIIGRFSGDEFILIVQNVHSDAELSGFIQSLEDALVDSYDVGDFPIHLSASMGVARFPQDGSTAGDLIKNADTALHQAKAAGKNRTLSYDAAMQESIARTCRIEAALRSALANNEFQLHFQPLFETASGRIRGFEALLRWSNPVLGQVSPMEFIPVAEETGLIVPIGEWVLREACRQNKQIQAMYDFPQSIMSVNISAVQLQDERFLQTVAAVLQETRLSPSSLEIELTETTLISSFDTSITVLQQLCDWGVKVSLDDFGTGYSSLSYLKRLPIHTLKIDKLFIQDISSESGGNAITESIIALVHKLGLDVVAEGIERDEQLHYLRKWRCDCVQGFLLSKPLPFAQLAGLFRRVEVGS